MKIYKCRNDATRGTWYLVESDDPEIAASNFAEEHELDQGDIVSIRGVGKFMIFTFLRYEALKIRTNSTKKV